MEDTQKRIDYDRFPIMVFFMGLQDESILDEFNVSPEYFKSLKEIWNERNPTQEHSALMDAHRKVVVEQLKYCKHKAVFEMLLNFRGDAREVFKAAKVTFIEDPVKRNQFLIKQIKKSEQKIKIESARLEKLNKQIEDSEKNLEEIIKDHLSSINKALASMEMHDLVIGDYWKFPIGKYEAYTELIEEKNKTTKNGR